MLGEGGSVLSFNYFFIFQIPECQATNWQLIGILLNTFYLQLYGVRHMVKDHSESKRKPADTTWAALSD